MSSMNAEDASALSAENQGRKKGRERKEKSEFVFFNFPIFVVAHLYLVNLFFPLL